MATRIQHFSTCAKKSNALNNKSIKPVNSGIASSCAIIISNATIALALQHNSFCSKLLMMPLISTTTVCSPSQTLLLPTLLLLLLAAIPRTLAVGDCASGSYPAPRLSYCVPCATMFQWQIMGESVATPIVTALVRLDNSTKHVQCVTTSGLDCHWGRSEPPGSINDTSTLLALGCDTINRMYYPLAVFNGNHWCNQVWLFLYKYCGNNATTIYPATVRAKSVTTINLSPLTSFGSSRACGGAIAGGHALTATTCSWVSAVNIAVIFDSRPWNATFAPKVFVGYRFVLGNELFLADSQYNLTISNNALEVFSISPPSSVVTYPITIRGINFPLEASSCKLSFDVYNPLTCVVLAGDTMISENLPLNFPTLAFLTEVAFTNPSVTQATYLLFNVVNRIPVALSLLPTKSYGGGVVTVFGANFVPNVGTCSGTVTTSSASTSVFCTVITTQTLIVQISYGAAASATPGRLAVSFTVPPTTTAELSLQVLASPVVTRPTQPYAYRSSVVTLIGTSFHPADAQTAACFICSNASTCVVSSETTVVVQVHSNTTLGVCDVLVKFTTPQMAYVTASMPPPHFVLMHHATGTQPTLCSTCCLE